MELTNEIKDRGVMAAVAVAKDVVVEDTSETLKALLDKLVAQRQAEEFPPHIKDAVRNLLKTGGFKPSGRNKPASEYLAQAAREGRFPIINNLVDINNYVSLTTGLPISLLDSEAIGSKLLLRYGREGERYVFNAGGQDIDIAGLMCACSGETDTPLGNPVKDSMTGKIKEHTRNVVGVIYAPSSGELAQVAKEQLEVFAELLRTEGKASSVETMIG